MHARAKRLTADQLEEEILGRFSACSNTSRLVREAISGICRAGRRAATARRGAGAARRSTRLSLCLRFDLRQVQMPRAGFEPAACRLGGDRSIQLSYRGRRGIIAPWSPGVGRNRGRNRFGLLSPPASASVSLDLACSSGIRRFKPNWGLTNRPS